LHSLDLTEKEDIGGGYENLEGKFGVSKHFSGIKKIEKKNCFKSKLSVSIFSLTSARKKTRNGNEKKNLSEPSLRVQPPFTRSPS